VAFFSEGELYIGKAQEKTAVFRTIHKRNAETGKSYPWISRGSALPNYYYFYLLDACLISNKITLEKKSEF
jgi:hypothetical protein